MAWIKIWTTEGAQYVNLDRVAAVTRRTRDYPSAGGVSTYPVLTLHLCCETPADRLPPPVVITDPEQVRLLDQVLELRVARDRRELESLPAAA